MKRILRSFFYALKGILYTLRHERNFQIECAVAGTTLLLMLFLPISPLEAVVLILTIALVLGMEMINTALERVMDILKPRVHPYARVIKDVMAGAVLIATIAAVLIGILIFFPYFFL